MLIKILIGVVVFAIALFIAARAAIWIADVQPKRLGIESGQLNTCPGTPNCVSSTSAVAAEHLEAIKYRGYSTTGIRAAVGSDHIIAG